MRMSDWSSGVCSSGLGGVGSTFRKGLRRAGRRDFAAQTLAECRTDIDIERTGVRAGAIRVMHRDLNARIFLAQLRVGCADFAVDVVDARIEQQPAVQRRCHWQQPRHSSLAQLTIAIRSEEHTSELQSLMRSSYAVFCLKKKHNTRQTD